MTKKLHNTHCFYFSQVKFNIDGKCKFYKGKAINIVKEIGLGEHGYPDSVLVDFGRPEYLTDKIG